MTCFGSTASVYAGTTRGAMRSARVEVARILVTGEADGNEFATIGDRIESDARDENERRVDLFALAMNAQKKRLHRRRSLAGERRQRNFIQLLACGDQEIGGRLPIEAEGGIARGDKRSIHGAHERVDAFIADFKVFVKRAQGFVERGRIELTAILAFVPDRATPKPLIPASTR